MQPIVARLVRLESRNAISSGISGVTNSFSCRPGPERADRPFIISISGYMTRMEGAVHPNTPLLVSHHIPHHPILP